jgi:hypothetical protein
MATPYREPAPRPPEPMPVRTCEEFRKEENQLLVCCLVMVVAMIAYVLMFPSNVG